MGYRSIDTGNWSMLLLTLCLTQVNNFFESYVGKTLKETRVPRENLFVQTKFVSQLHHKPFTPPYPPYPGNNADEACQLSLLRSLENLQTTYVDAFLINAPEITLTPMLSLLNILQNAKEQGTIRYSGLCNVATVDILRHLNNTLPGAIQIVQNPLHSPWDPEYKVLQYCRENGIQYNTFQTLTTSDRILQDNLMKFIAAEIEIPPQLVFLQFCVQSDITPLVGARSERNLLSVLPIANGEFEPLAREHMRAISRLLAEQTVINRYRSDTLLARRQKELRWEKGREKMQIDQRRHLQEIMAVREEREQEIVEQAKARAKAFAEKLKAEVVAEAVREKAEEEKLRMKVLESLKLGEREPNIKGTSNESTEAASTVSLVQNEEEGLLALTGRKKLSQEKTEAKS
jgi:diketogulonate reductase-like aldo/keto reductase